jgi:hypothetical protein
MAAELLHQVDDLQRRVEKPSSDWGRLVRIHET